MNVSGDLNRNDVIGIPKSAERCVVNFRSENCRLEIGAGCVLDGLEVNFNRPNQAVMFTGDNRIRGQLHLTAPRTAVSFGFGTRTNAYVWANLAEADTAIRLGAGCLLASVRFRTSDSHKIFDLETGKRINLPGDIEIGDRVWIAEDVLLLKGTRIGDGSVVGARAVVNGPLPPNSLSAGAPARVIRHNIRWEE